MLSTGPLDSDSGASLACRQLLANLLPSSLGRRLTGQSKRNSEHTLQHLFLCARLLNSDAPVRGRGPARDVTGECDQGVGVPRAWLSLWTWSLFRKSPTEGSPGPPSGKFSAGHPS